MWAVYVVVVGLPLVAIIFSMCSTKKVFFAYIFIFICFYKLTFFFINVFNKTTPIDTKKTDEITPDDYVEENNDNEVNADNNTRSKSPKEQTKKSDLDEPIVDNNMDDEDGDEEVDSEEDDEGVENVEDNQTETKVCNFF